MTTLGKYELHEQLGKGGFGVVYRATDNIGRTVAVKVLKPGFADDPEVLARFKREALAAGSLFHPHIATILDLDEADGRVFLAMRYIEGKSLDVVLKERQKLPLDEAITIIQQVSEGLQFAHDKGFIHRDIKPANIIISPTEGAVLTDFGLARSATTSGMSTTGAMLGTPAYMAPEIWRGQPATQASDIYSMGCIFYEMLTGKVLFEGDSPADVMTKHVLDGPQLDKNVHDPILGVLSRALAKNPAERYQSIVGFTTALNDLQPVMNPISIPVPQRYSVIPPVQIKSPTTLPTKRWQPWQTAVSMVAGLIVVILIIGMSSGWFSPKTTLTSPISTATALSSTATLITDNNEIQPITGANDLPRNETLYFSGQQWGSVFCWNPYSSNCNNAMAIAQQDNARVTMFETPYIYNMLDGKVYPLLADGAYSWNDEKTELTFKIKKAAKWSDGTAVTADDVAYTWATHVRYNDSTGAVGKGYIEDIIAIDTSTVVIKAKLDDHGKALYPLLVEAYVNSNYVIQKKWTQTLEARTNGDPAAFLADTAEDVVYSGPYHKLFADDTKIVLVRDDNYWGADATMWGKLPAPKYLAHVIYKDNAAGTTALKAGEVDVSQQFYSNVQDLWLKDNLPISTYFPDAPYDMGASLPTAIFNLGSYGLNNVTIRKAIAIAVDYDTIIANALTNQSATFIQVPRSLMNPTPGEQALYDHDAVADLQWAGNDIEGAKTMLDVAGIVDTDGDGWREYKGIKLSYVATCPNGWSDWQAAMEVVAAAGRNIGIDITTNYPEWSVYQAVITNWPLQNGYDIFMMWSDGAGPAQPWNRIRHLMSSEFAKTTNNWDGNWGGYINPEADALIQAIPTMSDTVALKEAYTQLVKIYLTDVPSFTLMYRPQAFHTVNENVWANFPHLGDGTNPPIPPLDLMDGYSIAGLYNLTLVK